MKKYFAGLFIAVLAFIMLLSISGCSFLHLLRDRLRGDGDIVSFEQTLSSEVYTLEITDIELYLAHNDIGNIIIDSNDDDKIMLKTDKNIKDTIDVWIDEEEKTILIKGDNDYKYDFTELTIFLGASVDKVKIDGGYDIDFNLAEEKNFELVLNGACSGQISAVLENCKIKINGASDIFLKGEADNCEVTINGASDIDALQFTVKNAEIDINGAGEYNVYATESLKANINGVGKIKYKGSPSEVKKNVAGIGTVEKIQD